jgi:sialidase-1
MEDMTQPSSLPRSRRRFLAQWGRVAGSAAFMHAMPALRLRAAVPALKVHDLRTISHEPEAYHGWPTLARSRGDDLLLAWSGGREQHVCPFGQVQFMRSSDGGETWCWPRVILDSGLDDRDAGILETPSGTLLATTFTSLAYQPILERARKEGRWDAARLQRWEAAHARLNAASQPSQLGQWILRSEDGGLNWSAKTPSVVNSPHGPIALADGRLLYAGKELWTGQRRVGVAFSEDDGRSWQWAAEIPAREGDDPAEYHELHAVEMPDRRVVVHIRNHNPSHAGETLQCESTDGGLSWTKPRSVGVWGLPSHLLRLADGRALMTYGHRRPPFGNQVRLSEDGRSWSAPMNLSTDGASGDLGYPSTAQLADGSLVSVWYERLANHPKAVLRQARWSLES